MPQPYEVLHRQPPTFQVVDGNRASVAAASDSVEEHERNTFSNIGVEQQVILLHGADEYSLDPLLHRYIQIQSLPPNVVGTVQEKKGSNGIAHHLLRAEREVDERGIGNSLDEHAYGPAPPGPELPR